jgi:hypothetical protein
VTVVPGDAAGLTVAIEGIPDEFRHAVAAQLLKAGFEVVDDPARPHDVTLKMSGGRRTCDFIGAGPTIAIGKVDATAVGTGGAILAQQSVSYDFGDQSVHTLCQEFSDQFASSLAVNLASEPRIVALAAQKRGNTSHAAEPVKPTESPSAPDPKPIDPLLMGQTVLLVHPSTVRVSDGARAHASTWPVDVVDALERRLVMAGFRVVSDPQRKHDWDVRVEGAVDGTAQGQAFVHATLRIEADGVTVDFAEMDPAAPVTWRADPEKVAVVLVNALGHAPRLIDQIKQRQAPAIAPTPKPVARPTTAPDPGVCRRKCGVGESLNALGCCEKG